MGGQAVEDGQQQAVEPDAEEHGQHRQAVRRPQNHLPGEGIGPPVGGGGVELIELIHGRGGGHKGESAHPHLEAELDHPGLHQPGGLGEPGQEAGHGPLALAGGDLPVGLHGPRPQRGEQEEEGQVHQQEDPELGVGHGQGCHGAGEVHAEDDVDPLVQDVDAGGGVPELGQAGHGEGEGAVEEEPQQEEGQGGPHHRQGDPEAEGGEHEPLGPGFQAAAVGKRC